MQLFIYFFPRIYMYDWNASAEVYCCFIVKKLFFVKDIILILITSYCCIWASSPEKPVFGVCDQGRLKLVCATTETS